MLENIQYIDSASISNLAVTAETVMNTLFATSISCSVVTASLFYGTASYSLTASYVASSVSASYLSGSTAVVTNSSASNIVLTNFITNPLSISTNSNNIGYLAGWGSSGSNNNFVGYEAGALTGPTSNAVFIGYQVGVSASAANNSVFIGSGQTGYTSTSASNSVFIGYSAGYTAASASGSIFIGYSVGNYSTNAIYSNFLGYFVGTSATNAQYSNFLGYYAGNLAANANNSIFIGYQSGYNDSVNNSGGHSSILIGDYTSTGGNRDSIAIGKGTQNSIANQCNIGNSLFINGIYSGSTPTSTSQVGIKAGIGTNNPVNAFDVVGNISCSVITASLYFGTASYALNANATLTTGGTYAITSSWSQTASYFSGTISNATNAVSASYAATASYLGSGSTNYVPLWNVNSLTQTSSIYQNGANIGIGTLNASQPLTVQGNALINGYIVNSASPPSNTNEIGTSAGNTATNAVFSNFLGYQAGITATNASYSNFIGPNAGNSATNAILSNFIGYRAGFGASSANNSIFIGSYAGQSDTVNNLGIHSSILIGDYTLTNGFIDSISIGKGTSNTTSSQANIGNSLYINNIYTGSTTNSSSQVGVKVGIGTYAITNSLDVVGNISCSVITASLYFGTASYALSSNTASTAATSSWPFFPVSSTQVETVMSVGISTNNPLEPLHVFGPLMVEGNPTPRIYAKSNDGGNSLVFDRYTGQSNYALYFGENADTGATYFRGAGYFFFGNQSTPAIFANGTNGFVGINNITVPTNSLDVNGNISCSVITASAVYAKAIITNISRQTASYTLKFTDHTILMSGSSALVATLPLIASGSVGIEYTIKNLSTYPVTITSSVYNNLIDNQSSQIITGQYTSVTVTTDGIGWWII